jgi:hypothetical protein
VNYHHHHDSQSQSRARAFAWRTPQGLASSAFVQRVKQAQQQADDASRRETSACAWLRSTLASSSPQAVAIAQHACAVFAMLRVLPPGRSGLSPAISFDRFMRDFVAALMQVNTMTTSTATTTKITTVTMTTTTTATRAVVDDVKARSVGIGSHGHRVDRRSSPLKLLRSLHKHLLPTYLARHTPMQVRALLLGVALDASDDPSAADWIRALSEYIDTGEDSSSGESTSPTDMVKRLQPIARLPEHGALVSSIMSDWDRWVEHAGQGVMLADSRGFGPALGPAQSLVVLSLLRPTLLPQLAAEFVDLTLGAGLSNRLAELERDAASGGGSAAALRAAENVPATATRGGGGGGGGGGGSGVQGSSNRAGQPRDQTQAGCVVTVACEEPGGGDAIECLRSAWVASCVKLPNAVSAVNKVPVFVSLADAADHISMSLRVRAAAGESRWLVVLDCVWWDRGDIVWLLNSVYAAGVHRTFLCCGSGGGAGGKGGAVGSAVPWRVRAEGETFVAPAHASDPALCAAMRGAWLRMAGTGRRGDDCDDCAHVAAATIAMVMSRLTTEAHSAGSIGTALALQAGPFARCLLSSIAGSGDSSSTSSVNGGGCNDDGDRAPAAATATTSTFTPRWVNFVRDVVAAHVETAVGSTSQLSSVSSVVTKGFIVSASRSASSTCSEEIFFAVDEVARARELRHWLSVMPIS